MTYESAIKTLDATISKLPRPDYMHNGAGQVFFLQRMQKLADRLENPEKDFRYIHVVGTSGKGSTSTMVYEILRAAGENVGLYTSPYVCVPTERIQWGGQLIDEVSFAAAVEKVMPVVDEIEKTEADWFPSYAEIFFAVSLVAFKQAGISTIVLEAGCGGRYDKTNIIPAPIVTLITPISLDHTDILGETVEAIAEQKAGVIKAGSAVFAIQPEPPIQEVLDSEAAGVGVEITYVRPNEQFDLSLRGAHQQVNANLAAAAARYLGLHEMAIRDGIIQAELPARVELMQEAPRVILDGAHSPAKMTALVESIKELEPWQKLHLIIAIKESKLVDDIVSPLTSLVNSVTITTFQLPGFGSHPPEAIVAAFKAARPELTVAIEPQAKIALETVLKDAAPDDLVVITGSLYLAGELRDYWYPTAQIMEERTLFPKTK
ncbi:MAG: hypothetical protein COW24_05660 [Candidatus Kerfeldbacteria bacterium CG15_BIG_FIL_POST_REV_8_21_14_020_45_12]|uniref:tetrahydrofolate synthase n=1 Tax=Candidatus Kerfeldbacteria bacterium CG15_BIG_FIL_POST_REV_8_21_14_020_45_12 TaxID=2014247 RepID=A0A2M7H2C4_9BACT|nr:MAG: hypothetical protein COW24_05660 [Candidatus Kerfeldbacteria bacterium CG15_BIG_FIL_POST_REV_8_21_14_020_45_12]PJA93695.1 MAG: hypothetical protein CO132_01895 [Candidatus Kerfeldbacteria bacterium CG_4_9_14_3_um_filter_45_8]